MTEHLETPDTAAQHGSEGRRDVVAQLEAMAARLDGTDQLDSMPLTDLAEQLAALHDRLQGALSELDRT